MKFSISAVFALVALVSAVAVEEPGMSLLRKDVLLMERAGANDGRGVAVGACCTPEKSKKGDVCKVNAKVNGVCAVADTAGCGKALTCVADKK